MKVVMKSLVSEATNKQLTEAFEKVQSEKKYPRISTVGRRSKLEAEKLGGPLGFRVIETASGKKRAPLVEYSTDPAVRNAAGQLDTDPNATWKPIDDATPANILVGVVTLLASTNLYRMSLLDSAERLQSTVARWHYERKLAEDMLALGVTVEFDRPEDGQGMGEVWPVPERGEKAP